MAQEDELIICRCEEVLRKEILAAIAEGARTADEVKRRTRAGMGLCQGRMCQQLVEQLIAKETGVKIGDLPPPSKRPPIRPVKIGVIIEEE